MAKKWRFGIGSILIHPLPHPNKAIKRANVLFSIRHKHTSRVRWNKDPQNLGLNSAPPRPTCLIFTVFSQHHCLTCPPRTILILLFYYAHGRRRHLPSDGTPPAAEKQAEALFAGGEAAQDPVLYSWTLHLYALVLAWRRRFGLASLRFARRWLNWSDGPRPL